VGNLPITSPDWKFLMQASKTTKNAQEEQSPKHHLPKREHGQHGPGESHGHAKTPYIKQPPGYHGQGKERDDKLGQQEKWGADPGRTSRCGVNLS